LTRTLQAGKPEVMSAPAADAPDSLSRLIPSRIARGFFVAMLSGIFFTLLNGSVKELTQEMPPMLVAWGRWISGIALLGSFLIWRVGLRGLRTNDLKLHCFRGLFHSSGYAFWYEAVVWLPLATVAALGFTGPIFVTLGAVLFLGETVHWRRWLAVGVGFLGMLVIVRPGMAELNPGMWMMMAAVPLIAGSNLVAKVVSSRDRPEVVVFWQSLIATIAFTPFGLWFWQMPTGGQFLLFLSAGFFGTLGYFFLTWSYRLLDISAMQPVTFLAIVWAALMDVAVWGKTSDLWTFVGAAIIVVATTYIAHREARMGART
jgi:drug/metabolite transporter (DMT)-like permease